MVNVHLLEFSKRHRNIPCLQLNVSKVYGDVAFRIQAEGVTAFQLASWKSKWNMADVNKVAGNSEIFQVI